MLLIILLGLTGGYTATIAMTLGPTMVEPPDQEVAGAVMTLALLSGLTVGASLALPLSVAVAS